MASALIGQIISRPSANTAEFNLQPIIGEPATLTVEINSVDKKLYIKYRDARSEVILNQVEKDPLERESFELHISAYRNVSVSGMRNRFFEGEFALTTPEFEGELRLAVKGVTIAYDTPQFFTAKISGLYFQIRKEWRRSSTQPFLVIHDEKGITILALALEDFLDVYYNADRMAQVYVSAV